MYERGLYRHKPPHTMIEVSQKHKSLEGYQASV